MLMSSNALPSGVQPLEYCKVELVGVPPSGAQSGCEREGILHVTSTLPFVEVWAGWVLSAHSLPAGAEEPQAGQTMSSL